MSVINIRSAARFFVYSEPTSMAFSFPKLRELIEKKLKREPESVDMYLFINKKRNYLKAYFFHKDGECIFSKKLPRGEFKEVEGELTQTQMRHVIEHVLLPGKGTRKFKIAA